MKSINDYLALRTRALNQQAVVNKGRDYVLVWLQQTLRGRDNPVIDAAMMMGRQLRKPVLVYQGLGQYYPHASDRLHSFVLQASRSLERDVIERGLAFVRHVDLPDQQSPWLVYQLANRATAVFVDYLAAFVGRWHAGRFASRTRTAVFAVDGMRVVPEQALPRVVRTTPAFREMITEQRDHWLDAPSDLETTRKPFSGDLPVDHQPLNSDRAIQALVARCDIDHSLAPVEWCSGDRQQALSHLAWAASEVIPRYASARNDPSDDRSVTRLSPYLHFGILSPREVAQAADHPGVDARNRWKFLDELLVWREFFHHRAVHAAVPNSYSNIPSYARDTLAKHADDPRPVLYDLDTLTHGRTHDSTWNAAQKQFLTEGWMHNNLRMYWGKQLIGWLPTPEQAWTTACHLNDRLSLDGRDPATYGCMQWCFGASKPAREVAVYGKVPRKTDAALIRRCAEWLQKQADREVPTVHIPEQIDLIAHPQAIGRSRT